MPLHRPKCPVTLESTSARKICATVCHLFYKTRPALPKKGEAKKAVYYTISDLRMDRETITLSIAVVGCLLGLAGFCLSLFNSWLLWNRGRVSIRVVPKLYATTRKMGRLEWDRLHPDWDKKLEPVDPKLCVEVINCGAVAVTMDEVGFGRRRQSTRYVIDDGFLGPEPQLKGRRLEPHSKLMVLTPLRPKDLYESYGRVTFAYVTTASDKMFRGSSPILKQTQCELILEANQKKLIGRSGAF